MTAKDQAEGQEDRQKSGLRENIEAILIAILLALLIRTFVVQAFKIPSGSMRPTLKIGDHILVNKFVYGVEVPFFNIPVFPGKQPERKDIIVFKYPENPDKDFIKRVIGVGGDIVSIKDKQVFVNQKPLAEPYAQHTEADMVARRDNLEPVRVPENKLFVMGDNRENSHDSRFWGFVDRDAVLGEAFVIYWSWDRQAEGLIDSFRWGRIGDMIQ